MRDLSLARSHAFGDRDLGETGRASAVCELAREFAALERGGDAQMDVRVVGCELVDERVEVVVTGRGSSLTQIWVIRVCACSPVGESPLR